MWNKVEVSTWFIWISTETFTERDKDWCNYFGKNKQWQQVKCDNSLIKTSNKEINKNNSFSNYENYWVTYGDCWQCCGTGRCTVWDWWYASGSSNTTTIMCTKCMGTWKNRKF